jgi:ribosome-binding factor A
MKAYKRTDRVGDLIQAELAKLIQSEVKDPRLKSVTLMGVNVTRDFAHAKIFFTVHDEANELAKAEVALKKASGFLRARLAEEISLRIIPELHFRYDDTLSRGKRIDDLLSSL